MTDKISLNTKKSKFDIASDDDDGEDFKLTHRGKAIENIHDFKGHIGSDSDNDVTKLNI